MRNTIAYLEIPVSTKDSAIRFITVLVTLILASYVSNKKLYLFSNIFLSILLTLVYTDRLDYTIIYSIIVGLGVFGYYNFRIYGPKLSEPYKFTGYGVAMCTAAGIFAHLVSKQLEE